MRMSSFGVPFFVALKGNKKTHLHFWGPLKRDRPGHPVAHASFNKPVFIPQTLPFANTPGTRMRGSIQQRQQNAGGNEKPP